MTQAARRPHYRACVTRRLPAAVAVLVLALAGCGGEDDPATPPGGTGGSSGGGVPGGSGGSDVTTEVSSIAPALESAVRGTPYPQSVDEAVDSLAEAGIDLAPGTEVGGYTYDPDAVEFVLCLQDADGAWASYDTAPMGVRDSGTEGGCPTS